ncbi:MAG: hypothetical protein RMJ83_03695 [Armatimonadota bacterium]|nr:hypothetical protein [Armatimonadota bacterium]
MPKRYRGVVRGGVIVLEPGAQLPEGTEVEVVEHKTADAPTNGDSTACALGNREGCPSAIGV